MERIVVRGGRAVGVRTADGREAEARKAVLADTGAPQLYLELLDRELVPARVFDGIAPLPVRRGDGQGRLGARRADPVGGARRGARRAPST